MQHTPENELSSTSNAEDSVQSLLDPDAGSRGKSAWKNYRVMVPVWAALITLIWLGVHFGVDKRVIAAGVLVVGLLSNAFLWLLGIVAVVPVVGPLIVKVLALPFIWLLNALGYFVALVAIKRGYSKDVLTYRGLTVALLVGVVIGYIIGKYV